MSNHFPELGAIHLAGIDVEKVGNEAGVEMRLETRRRQTLVVDAREQAERLRQCRFAHRVLLPTEQLLLTGSVVHAGS